MDYLEKESIEYCISQGMTTAETADHLCCGRTTVVRYAKKFGLSFPRGRRKKRREKCRSCGNPIPHRNKYYCTHSCQHKYQRMEYISRWLSGEESGSKGTGDTIEVSGHVRNYLLEEANYQCVQCEWGETNPHTGTIPLEIDHIDGNWKNNSPDNLRVLCPNCHALTPTHKGANSGHGNGSRKYSGNRGDYWKNK